MRKLKKVVFMLAISALTFLAGIASASACIISHYQPEVPKSLQK